MKKGQKKRVWTVEQKKEIVQKHLDEHISIKKVAKQSDKIRSKNIGCVRN